jgi:hypothetical protein
MSSADIDWGMVRDVLEECRRPQDVTDGCVSTQDVFFDARARVLRRRLIWGEDEHEALKASYCYAIDKDLVVLGGYPPHQQVWGLTHKGRDLLSVLESDGVLREALSAAREGGLSLTADALIEAGSRIMAGRILDAIASRGEASNHLEA